jgi:hypothetical protein
MIYVFMYCCVYLLITYHSRHKCLELSMIRGVGAYCLHFSQKCRNLHYQQWYQWVYVSHFLPTHTVIFVNLAKNILWLVSKLQCFDYVLMAILCVAVIDILCFVKCLLASTITLLYLCSFYFFWFGDMFIYWWYI